MKRAILLSLSLLGAATLAGAESDGSGDGRYVSQVHGLSFMVPSPLEVREYDPEAVDLGEMMPEGWFKAEAQVRLHVAGEGQDFASFDEFAVATLHTTCGADGGVERIYCDGARSSQAFSSRSGLRGRVLTMFFFREEAVEGGWLLDIDSWSPVFLFDVSDAVPGDGWAMLSVHPPPHWGHSPDSSLIRDIARSLAMASGAEASP